VWNFAPAPSEFSAEDLSSLIAATDIFVVNEHEALTAARILGCDSPDIENAGAFLSRQGCICVITSGARGAFAFQPDGTREAVAATPIRPVDTTGAGDTFVGILASGLDENLDFTKALDRACRGASMACLSSGAQAGMPTRERLAQGNG
jgi:ribokinase